MYCAPSDVRNALAPDGASGGTNTAADLDDPSIIDAINEASSVVDSYVSGPYDTSIGDVIPTVISFWTRDIAAYYATLTWRKSKDLTPQDPVTLRYQAALAGLEGIAAGTVSIPMPQDVGEQADVEVPVGMQTPLPWGNQLFNWWDFDLTGYGASGRGGWAMWPGYPW
jgi:phage gp36-like protein